MSEAGIIVFVRLDSRRLPGKALRPLAGRPLLGRVLDRMKRVPGARLVAATSTRVVDDPVAAFCGGEDVPVFRGSAEDVLGRAVAAAAHFGFDPVIRISGDSPFVCPLLVTDMMKRYRCGAADIVTNLFPRSFPAGCSAEVISAAALRRLASEAMEPEDREHVTPYVYRRPDRFIIDNVVAEKPGWTSLHLAVDTEADWARAETILTETSIDSGTPIAAIIERARMLAA